MNSQSQTPSKADAVAMGAFVVAGVAIAAWTAWNAGARIAELVLDAATGDYEVPVATG